MHDGRHHESHLLPRGPEVRDRSGHARDRWPGHAELIMKLPATQHAIQLVGPGELRLAETKEVPAPGPHQVLARVEAVGLCFSDLKLLKQFSQHARKGEILEGLPREVLDEIPSYVPGNRPTVPGHEVVCTIVAVGERVRRHSVGERCLVQTDYRTL